jgi:LacI family transcriptional regulator
VPNPFFASVALGVEQEALANGCSVLMYNTQSNWEWQRRGVETLIQRRVDAILFTTPGDEANVLLAKRAGIPVVQVERPTPVETHTVTIDNYVGSLAAVNHLIELGHRRIAYIGATPGTQYGSQSSPRNDDIEGERLAGYLDALEAHHLPVLDGLICLTHDYYLLDGNPSPGDGYFNMKRLLGQQPRPTAVFATCDILAAGALQAIYERGLRVPDHISVIGFDDTYAPYLSPPLTTVEQPMLEIGKTAARIVLEQLQHDPTEQRPFITQRLSTRLVIRSSTGRPYES